MQSDLIKPEAGQEPDSVRLFSDAAFNVSGRIAIAIVGVFILPLMLHHFGAALYGVWLAALAVVGLCATVDLGMGWAVAREAASSSPDEPATRTFLRSVLLGFVATGILGFFIIGLVGFFSRGRLHTLDFSPRQVQVVFIFAGMGFLGEWVFTYVQSLLYGLRRFALWNAMLISVTLLRAVGIVILLAGFGAGLLAVALWHASCSLAAAGIGLWIAGRRARLFAGYGEWFSLGSLRSRLKFGIYSQLSAVAATGLWQAGPLILGYGSSTTAVTSLGVGQRLPTGLSGIGASLAEAVFPAAAEHQANENEEESRQVLLRGTRWTVLPVLPGCLLLMAVGPEILRLWIGYTDPAASMVLRLISIAIICDSFSAAGLHLLWGRGRSGLLLTVFGIATGLAVLAMYFVAPMYGAVGVGACILGSCVLYSLSLLWLSARETGLGLGNILRTALKGNLAASFLAAGSAFAVLRLLKAPLAVQIGLALLAAFVVWVAYMFALGLDEADLEAAKKLPIRRILQKIYPLRAAYYILFEIAECVRSSHPRELTYYEHLYSQTDPYSYSQKPRELDRHKRNAAMLARLVNGNGNARVCELGCSEGLFTETIEPLCGRLTALDLSPTALERARQRRDWRPTTGFARFDLLGDQPWPEVFDVITAMHTVEFARRSFNRRALRRLVEGLAPGGYLLLDSQRHMSELEDSFFRRFFYRGKWLNRMFAQHPDLEVVEEYVDDLDVITIFRRR